jgi:hypothetical protein
MLYSIGDQKLCIGELRTRGYYLGTRHVQREKARGSRYGRAPALAR